MLKEFLVACVNSCRKANNNSDQLGDTTLTEIFRNITATIFFILHKNPNYYGIDGLVPSDFGKEKTQVEQLVIKNVLNEALFMWAMVFEEVRFRFVTVCEVFVSQL